MTLLAVAAALAAAALFGLSSVLEQRATKKVPPRRPLSPWLLLDLARRPRWLAAIIINGVGSVLQIVALHFGALALVQPLLVCNLLFAVLIAVAMRHRSPDRVVVAGVICCVAGLACFIAVARPGAGHHSVPFMAAVPLLAALAAVLAGCLAVARWGPSQIRPLCLALACGADFGVTAFLLKLVPDTLSAGFADPVRQWPLYVLAIIGPAGFLLNQNAFQAGLLIAPVLAVITTVDPLTSIGIAHVWLNESIASTAPALAGQALALTVMTGGIVALAHRSPASPAQGQHAAPSGGQHGQRQEQQRDGRG